MTLYKVIHQYKLDGRMERKAIGIYSSPENAGSAIDELKQKPGFCHTQDGFRIKKTFRLWRPKLLDKTFWVDGFVTYTYQK